MDNWEAYDCEIDSDGVIHFPEMTFLSTVGIESIDDWWPDILGEE